MPDDKTKMDEADTGQQDHGEAEQRAELIREITASLDNLSPEELREVFAMLILLVKRQKK